MSLQLKPLSAEHLSDVWRIECEAHTHPWAQSMINDLNSRGACHYVLLEDSLSSTAQVVGYFYAQHIVGEVTLLNIAIDPKRQGCGLGRQLMADFLSQCQVLSAESAWLEVRASNQKAYNLYESLGFNEVDRRYNYYPTSTGSREDAIIMSYLFF